ncbi:hypothetical protein D3C85_1801120 [compost metagenome]
MTDEFVERLRAGDLLDALVGVHVCPGTSAHGSRDLGLPGERASGALIAVAEDHYILL